VHHHGLGGLSSHDASFGHWGSLPRWMVAVVFMALAGISFARYFIVWRSRTLGRWRKTVKCVPISVCWWVPLSC
jgi:Trk-type K+ transport system membrane component